MANTEGESRSIPSTAYLQRISTRAANRLGNASGLMIFQEISGLEPQKLPNNTQWDYIDQILFSIGTSLGLIGQLINAAKDSALPAVPGFPWPNPEPRHGTIGWKAEHGAEPNVFRELKA